MVRTITETVNGVSYEYTPASEEAAGLVFGDRNQAYGHPVEDFSKTAGFWTVYKGVVFTPEDVAQMMCFVKVSRQMFRPKRDNPVDNIGYQECLQRIVEARAAGVLITDWSHIAYHVEYLLQAAEEMDRITDLIPDGASIEDLVACWEAHHREDDTVEPVIPHDWVDRALATCGDSGDRFIIDNKHALEDHTAFLHKAAAENWSVNSVNCFLINRNYAGFTSVQWAAITSMVAADAYNERCRKVAQGTEERIGG
jgi:hypothetical protein